MTFGLLNLTMLLGLAAVAIPVLVHLLNRRRHDVVDWGAMQFLQVGEARRRRLFLEELLLMLLRMGLIALMVLALAAPYAAGPAVARFADRPHREAVLVIDGSASTAAAGAGPAPHDAAREWALRFLDELKPGDAVAVIDARGVPVPRTDGLTRDLAAARDAIRQLPPPAGGCDGPRAVAEALRLLKERGERPEQDVVVLTDGQRHGWAGAAAAWQQVTQQLGSEKSKNRPRLWLAEFPPDGPAANASLGAAQAPELAWVGQPVRFRATAAGLTGAPGGVRARLEVNGEAVQSVTVPVPADGRPVPLTFTHPFAKPGSYLVSLTLEPGPDVPDVLPADNRRDLAVTVRDGLPVLIVDGDPELSPDSSSFFLGNALAPADGPSAVRAATVALPDFTPGRLTRDVDPDRPGSRPRVLILADVPALTAAQRQAADQFLAGGGGVWVILGPRALATGLYNEELYAGGRGWLPCRLEEVVGGDGKPGPASPDVAGLTHPALAVFAGRPDCALGEAKFPRWWRVAVPADTGVVTVARLTSGEPMLLERARGAGRVLVSTVPFDRSWRATLPRVWEYPVLVHELVYHLAGASGADHNLDPGQPIRFRPDGEGWPLPATARVHGPGGRTDAVAAEAWPLVYADTAAPGPYRLEFPGRGPVYYAVRPDDGESELTYRTDREREELAAAVPLRPGADPAEVGLAVVPADHREDLWWLAMLGVILLLCGEVWLTRRMALGR